MSREEFIGKLQLCYFGDRNAFEEIVSSYIELKEQNEKAIEKLELLLNDLRINSKAEKEEGKSYFSTDLFAIRVKEIYKTISE